MDFGCEIFREDVQAAEENVEMQKSGDAILTRLGAQVNKVEDVYCHMREIGVGEGGNKSGKYSLVESLVVQTVLKFGLAAKISGDPNENPTHNNLF